MRDTEKFLSVVTELWTEAGKQSVLKVSGISMMPMLLDGDSIRVDHSLKDLKRGDIGVFKRDDLIFVHRVLFRNQVGDTVHYRSKGDWLLYMDAPLGSDNIVGKVLSFVRDAKQYDLDTAASRMYAHAMALYSIGIAVDGKIAYLLDRFMGFIAGRSSSEEGVKEIRFFRHAASVVDRALLTAFHSLFFRFFNRGTGITSTR